MPKKLLAVLIVLYAISHLAFISVLDLSDKSDGDDTAVIVLAIPAALTQYTGLDLLFLLLPATVMLVAGRPSKPLTIALAGYSVLLFFLTQRCYGLMLGDADGYRSAEIRKVLPAGGSSAGNYLRYLFVFPEKYLHDGSRDALRQYQPFLGLRLLLYSLVSLAGMLLLLRRRSVQAE